MAILGFSSSPIIGGNVDRMVQAILQKCGDATEFFNLTGLSYGPCRACVHLCAGDNLCKLDDDLKQLYPKIIAAGALVLGTPVYHSNMNGFMTVFLERLWGFRHQRFPLQGKPYAVVASAAGIGNPAAAINAVKSRMSAYRAVFIESVWFNSRIFPCLKCGYGLTCDVGRLYEFYGAEGQKKLKITKRLFGQWEDSTEIISKLDVLAQQIKTYLP
jgi:hypothetical protein